MLGGTVVETEGGATGYAELLGREVLVGDALSEPPCVPEWWLAEERKRGRPCPRVVLEPENEGPAELAQVMMLPHVRHLGPAIWDALSGDLPSDEADASLVRAARALRTKPVMDTLYPPRAESAPNRK